MAREVLIQNLSCTRKDSSCSREQEQSSPLWINGVFNLVRNEEVGEFETQEKAPEGTYLSGCRRLSNFG